MTSRGKLMVQLSKKAVKDENTNKDTTNTVQKDDNDNCYNMQCSEILSNNSSQNTDERNAVTEFVPDKHNNIITDDNRIVLHELIVVPPTSRDEYIQENSIIENNTLNFIYSDNFNIDDECEKVLSIIQVNVAAESMLESPLKNCENIDIIEMEINSKDKEQESEMESEKKEQEAEMESKEKEQEAEMESKEKEQEAELAPKKGRKKPFKVTELNYDDFYDLKGLQVSIGNNFQQNSEGEKINWNEIKSIKVLKEEPFTFYYRTSYSQQNFKKVLPSKTVRNKSSLTLKKAYKDTMAILESKYKGLIELCEKNQIIKKYHEFYKSLKCEEKENLKTGRRPQGIQHETEKGRKRKAD